MFGFQGEDERKVKYTKLQQIQSMNSEGKSTFCIVNSDMACISTELANLIYDKSEKNKVLRMETIQQELVKSEKVEQQIELNKEQDTNSNETLLI